ncbi:hypothetical protein C1X61_01425 [Pseudomonas sp. FW215-T2]|nr:hypothetical protein C1X61_01425 [Pseudomonas sp. FW215-T2]PNA16859.1 hypothetical protein C1X62_01900 [Pseudomonas sp. FW215-R3]PNB39762.1 hypothetical protein C1X63_02360 [Pseudomonas sp. FW305-131]
MLAKKLRTPRLSRMNALSLTSIASKLAPTGSGLYEIQAGRAPSGCRPFLCKRLCKAAATYFLSP